MTDNLPQANAFRNICAIAHVDHGKTTFVDSLLAANGIISERQAGRLRYLDSRPDEQQRGITMKTSAVALVHHCEERQKHYVINMIDSPGHVDFVGEVFTALSVCDGVFLIVDVVEGVCAQTRNLLTEAFRERLRPILVLNKIDRLINELCFTPLEAYQRLRAVVEQANAIAGQFALSNAMLAQEKESIERDEFGEEIDELDDSRNVYFDVTNRNVIFASAFDGWAFDISEFATLYSNRLGIKHELLQRTLWGDFYLDAKQKRIRRGAFDKGKPQLFVQFVLENLWQVYKAVQGFSEDRVKFDKIISALGIKLPPRELRSGDSNTLTHAVMSRWLPLSRRVLDTAVLFLPSPLEFGDDRIARLLSYAVNDCSSLRKYFKNCDNDRENDSVPTIALVTKMFLVDSKDLTSRKTGVPLPQADEVQGDEQTFNFIGFARVFSGRLRKGMRLHVLLEGSEKREEVEIGDVYRLMGRELEGAESIQAGHICGIAGLENVVFRSATLTSDPSCPAICTVHRYAEPIVRVAVEPCKPSRLPVLTRALQLLGQSDPTVKTFVQNTGEHVIAAAGEVHLQRCITDLRERLMLGDNLDITVSEPIVPFQETISEKAFVHEIDDTTAAQSTSAVDYTVSFSTTNQKCTFRLQTEPMSIELMKCIDAYGTDIMNLLSKVSAGGEQLGEFRKEILEAGFADFDKIWSFGPRRAAANLLLNCTGDEFPGLSQSFSTPAADVPGKYRDYGMSVINGFHSACLAGPICEEPIRGVIFRLLDFSVLEDGAVDAQLAGQMITAMKDGCRQAFQARSQRLMMAMYRCEIQIPLEEIGRVHSVIGRRRGRVVNETMAESSNLFTLVSEIPVAESFGIADDLRKQTSGHACPQLIFSHWETLPIDPYWVPTTDEEIDYFGKKADSENIARRYMNAVRRRKGLWVDEKVVEHAEKQRNLTRNK